MATAKLLAQADLAVQSSLNGEVIVLVGAVVLIGMTIAWFSYVLDRWSWTQRKAQRKWFYERL